MIKSLCCMFLITGVSPLLASLPENQPENIRIYNENVYPEGGYYYGGYYGNPPIPTPAEAFPDDAEANYLWDKMQE